MNKPLSIIANIFLKPVIKIVFIRKIKGIENIPRNNFILASNHQSYLDILFSGVVCAPKKFTYIGQIDGHKGMGNLIVKALYFAGGVISLNRKDNNSKKQAVSKAIHYLENGYSLVIYPEGTRSVTGDVKEGKWGVAKLFLRTSVPILPLGIKNAIQVFPKNGKLKIKKIVELNIGMPLYFEKEYIMAKHLDPDSKEYNQVCVQITNKIMKEIKRLVYAN